MTTPLETDTDTRVAALNAAFQIYKVAAETLALIHEGDPDYVELGPWQVLSLAEEIRLFFRGEWEPPLTPPGVLVEISDDEDASG